MSLFVFSTNSIIGISIRKKTLVPKVFKFASKAMYIQHVPQVEAVNTASSFNSNAFFDEKQIVHSSIHLPHFLHHTIHTNTHTHMHIFTQKLTFVSERNNQTVCRFLHTASRKFLFRHTWCQCPSKKWKHWSLNKETNSLIWLNLTLTWVISRDWMFWFPQNTFH